MKNTGLFLLVWFVLSHPSAYAQATDFTLSPAVNLNTTLNESSGLEYCRGKLWSHNDSGGEPKIYSIDPTNGSILQTITLAGITNVDWEDLAADGYYLYIADVGNNSNGARTDLVIYKINLDDIPLTGNATIPYSKIEAIRFYYPEQGLNPTPVAANKTSYDCEAILIRNDVIHLFTKDWNSEESGSYKTDEYLLPNIPHPSGPSNKYAAKLFNSHSTDFLVTGADNAGISQVILVGYRSKAPGAQYAKVYSGFQGDDISTGTSYSKLIGYPDNINITILGISIIKYEPGLGQVEAICFGEDPFKGYLSNEKITGNYSEIGITVTLNYPATVKSFTVSYSDANKTQITTGTAGGGIQGSIRYNSERKHMEGFNGLYWIPLDVVQ